MRKKLVAASFLAAVAVPALAGNAAAADDGDGIGPFSYQEFQDVDGTSRLDATVKVFGIPIPVPGLERTDPSR